MLFINQKDIDASVNASDLITAIEKAYSIQDDPETVIPDRMHISHGQNTFLLMPGFTKEITGTKLVSVFPGNKAKNKPAIYGIFVLNDTETGEPVAIINGTKLTAVRTGAVGAAAAKHLAPSAINTLGVIGTGVQAYHQALMIAMTLRTDKIIIGARDLNKAEQMKEQLVEKLPGISFVTTTDNNYLVTASDVIVTATSSSAPVFDVKAGELENKTIIAIGSYKPDMQELPLSVFENAGNVFVDTPHAKAESGDIRIPLSKGLIKDESVIPFNEVLKRPELKNDGLNVFKSVGMALFDLTCAELIFKKVKEKGLGTELEL